ncbi:MAG: hypothetical protein AAF530_08385 [Pseudomonadota bacterium]
MSFNDRMPNLSVLTREDVVARITKIRGQRVRLKHRLSKKHHHDQPAVAAVAIDKQVWPQDNPPYLH